MVFRNCPPPAHPDPARNTAPSHTGLHAPLHAVWRISSTTAATLCLLACASTPLPPWPAARSPQPTAPASKLPVLQVPAPAAVTQPVAPPASTPAAQATADPYSPAVAAHFPDPSTTYSTPGLQSGRSSFTSNAEITDWLRSLDDQALPGIQADVLNFGVSQQGELLQALLLTRAPSTDAPTLLATGRPTVLIVAQQHGNEPAGSEAALVVARELAQGMLEPLLQKINVIVVPRANPDGAAADQRSTANGIDLNRDHLLLNSPEARALAQLVRDYQPIAVLDAHEYTVVGRYLQKFGAIQKYDALLQYAMVGNLPDFLTRASEEWYRRPLLAAFKSQQLSSEWYYTTSTTATDYRIAMGGVQPDTGRNVNGLKNAISFLVESRGVGIGRQHIQRRVHTQVTAMVSVLQSTANRAEQLSQLRSFVDRDTSSLACRNKAVVSAGPTSAQYELTMLDPATGADRQISVDWDSSLQLQTLKSRARPCGYWLSAAATPVVERLQILGVQVLRLTEAGAVLGESYRATASTEGIRQDARGDIADSAPILRTEVALVRGLVDMPPGSYYVPLGQPLANLVLAALEPDTQNSYYANHILPSLGDAVRVMAEPSLKLEKMP